MPSDRSFSIKMEVASVKELVIVGFIAFGVLFISLVIGATGPAQYLEYTTYASNCSEPSYTPCSGGVVLNQNQTWIFESPAFATLNRWWVLNMFPYVSENDPYYKEGIQTSVPVVVTLLGRSRAEEDWQVILNAQQTSYATMCLPFQTECFGFSIIDENYLQYPYYKVALEVPNSNNQTSWMGDAKFDVWTMNPPFNKEVLVVRGVYAVIALGVALLWYIVNLKLQVVLWTVEQKFTAVFLFSLFIMFNPFYFMDFTKVGWYFPFMNSLFETQFVSLFLMFCLVYLEYLKNYERHSESEGNRKLILFKVGLVTLHFLFTNILFIWNNVLLEKDALVSQSNGMMILYYFVSALYGGIIVWVIVLVITAIPAVQNSPELKVKFLFVIVPVSVIIASIALGVFTGTYGIYGRTAVSFYYFFSLYAVFVFLMAYGTWPIRAGFREVSESTGLFSEGKRSGSVAVVEEDSVSNPFSNAQYFEEDTSNFKATPKKEQDYSQIANKLPVNDDENAQL